MELKKFRIYLLIVTMATILSHVKGSGSLYDPPNRAVMWKYGYNTEKNYNYMQLNCGGEKQPENGPFTCGVCGDPVKMPKDHELGGKFGTGMISRYYPAGIKEMPVKVELLAFEKGFFEFRICAANNNSVTQECLDENLLPIKEGYLAGTPMRFFPKSAGDFRLTVAVPPNLECERCVLQWRYHTANSWGTDPETGSQGLGKGPQEEFRNCADIRIGGEIPKDVQENPFFAPVDEKPRTVPIDKPTDQGKRLDERNDTVLTLSVTPQNVDRFATADSRRLNGAGSVLTGTKTIGQGIVSETWVGVAETGEAGGTTFEVPKIQPSGSGGMIYEKTITQSSGRSGDKQSGKHGTLSTSRQDSAVKVDGTGAGGLTEEKHNTALELSTGSTITFNLNDLTAHLNGNFAQDNLLLDGAKSIGGQKVVSHTNRVDGKRDSMKGMSGISIEGDSAVISGQFGKQGEQKNKIADKTGISMTSDTDIIAGVVGIGDSGQNMQRKETKSGQMIVQTGTGFVDGVVGPAPLPVQKNGVTVSLAGVSNEVLTSGVGKMKDATRSGFSVQGGDDLLSGAASASFTMMQGSQTDVHRGGSAKGSVSDSTVYQGVSFVEGRGDVSDIMSGAHMEQSAASSGGESVDTGMHSSVGTNNGNIMSGGIESGGTAITSDSVEHRTQLPAVAISAVSPETGRQRIFLIRASRPPVVNTGTSNNMFVSEGHQPTTRVTKVPSIPVMHQANSETFDKTSSKQTVKAQNGIAAEHSGNMLDIKSDSSPAAEILDPLRTQSATAQGHALIEGQIVPTSDATLTATGPATAGEVGISEIDAFRNELVKGSLQQGDAAIADSKTITTTSKPPASDIAAASIDTTISDLLKEAQSLLQSTAELTKQTKGEATETPKDTGLSLDIGTLLETVAGTDKGGTDVAKTSETPTKSDAASHSAVQQELAADLSKEKASISLGGTQGVTGMEILPANQLSEKTSIGFADAHGSQNMGHSNELTEQTGMAFVKTQVLHGIEPVPANQVTKQTRVSVAETHGSQIMNSRPADQLTDQTATGSIETLGANTDFKSRQTMLIPPIGNRHISSLVDNTKTIFDFSGGNTAISLKPTVTHFISSGGTRESSAGTRTQTVDKTHGALQEVNTVTAHETGPIPGPTEGLVTSLDTQMSGKNTGKGVGQQIVTSLGTDIQTGNDALQQNADPETNTNQFRILTPADWLPVGGTSETNAGISTVDSSLSSLDVGKVSGGSSSGLGDISTASGSLDLGAYALDSQVSDLGLSLNSNGGSSSLQRGLSGDTSSGIQEFQMSGKNIGKFDSQQGLGASINLDTAVKRMTTGGGLTLGGQVIDLSSRRSGSEGAATAGGSSVDTTVTDQQRLFSQHRSSAETGRDTMGSMRTSVSGMSAGAVEARRSGTADPVNIEQQINSFNIETIPFVDVIGPGLQMSSEGNLEPGFGPRGSSVSDVRGVERNGGMQGSAGDRRVMSREDRMRGMIAGDSGTGSVGRRTETGFRIALDPRTGLEQVIPDQSAAASRDVTTGLLGGRGDMTSREAERLVIRRTDGGIISSVTDPEYFLDMSGGGSVGSSRERGATSVGSGISRGLDRNVITGAEERSITRERTGGATGFGMNGMGAGGANGGFTRSPGEMARERDSRLSVDERVSERRRGVIGEVTRSPAVVGRTIMRGGSRREMTGSGGGESVDGGGRGTFSGSFGSQSGTGFERTSASGRTDADRSRIDFGFDGSIGDRSSAGLDMGSAFTGGGDFSMTPIVGGTRVIERAGSATRGTGFTASDSGTHTGTFSEGVRRGGDTSTRRLISDSRSTVERPRPVRRRTGAVSLGSSGTGMGGGVPMPMAGTGIGMSPFGGSLPGPGFGTFGLGSGFPMTGGFGPFGPTGADFGLGGGGGMPPFSPMGFGPGMF